MEATPTDADSSGRYLYAIVPAGFSVPDGLSGLDGRPVLLIQNGNLAAVVSTCMRKSLRPERAHLAAHQAVMNALMAVATVLPVAFGTMAQSDDELRDFLADSAAPIMLQLAHVQGAVEFSLRVRLNVPDVVAFLVDATPALQAQRYAMFADGRTPGHHERIALGMQFERVLEQLREQQASQLLPVLTPICIDICRNPSHTAAELLNLACLVRRQDQPAFDAVLADAAVRFDDNLTFDLSGPWAPHHFCSVPFAPGDQHVRH